jgi:hypothetical protein
MHSSWPVRIGWLFFIRMQGRGSRRGDSRSKSADGRGPSFRQRGQGAPATAGDDWQSGRRRMGPRTTTPLLSPLSHARAVSARIIVARRPAGTLPIVFIRQESLAVHMDSHRSHPGDSPSSGLVPRSNLNSYRYALADVFVGPRRRPTRHHDKYGCVSFTTSGPGATFDMVMGSRSRSGGRSRGHPRISRTRRGHRWATFGGISRLPPARRAGVVALPPERGRPTVVCEQCFA